MLLLFQKSYPKTLVLVDDVSEIADFTNPALQQTQYDTMQVAIHILRQRVYGLSLTHPFKYHISLNTILNFSKNCHFLNPYTFSSMTSLLAHTVAQPTKWRFLPKNLSQLVIFVIELAFT